MKKIILHGYQGKMGKVVADLIRGDPMCMMSAGIDIMEAQSNVDFLTFTDIFNCEESADVIIDFSTAVAIPKLVEYAVSKKIPAVICTTGLSEETQAVINEASKKVAIFQSANMSIGINLLASVLKKISGSLYDDGFDIEIVEKHHHHKIDAPSGTALLLADAIQNSMKEEFVRTYDRSNVRKPRDKNEIGIHAVRGGSIVGEHTVIFAGKDEVIELNHLATSKEVFASGAIKAAKFLAGKTPGIYDMKNVMDDIT